MNDQEFEIPQDLPPMSMEEISKILKEQNQKLQNFNNTLDLNNKKNTQSKPDADTITHNKQFKNSKGNPLVKWHRKSQVQINLPSRCYYYEPDDIQLSANGEVAIFGMTSMDELILKSPDALFNGSALEQVIASCVPAIKNPKKLCHQDIEALMLGIKMATYGHFTNVSSRCPHCNHENEYEIDLNYFIQNMTYLTEPHPIRLDDNLLVYIRPRNFELDNKYSVLSIEQTQIVKQLSDQNLDEETKIQIVSDTYTKLRNMTLDLMIESIDSIIADGQIVDNKDYIFDFIVNADRRLIDPINDAIISLNQPCINKDLNVVCENCEKTHITGVEFNPANFFDTRS